MSSIIAGFQSRLDQLNSIQFHLRTDRDKAEMHTLYEAYDEIRRPYLNRSRAALTVDEINDFVIGLIRTYYKKTKRPVDIFVLISLWNEKRSDQMTHQKMSAYTTRLIASGDVFRIGRRGSKRNKRILYCLSELPQTEIDRIHDNREQIGLENKVFLGENVSKPVHGNTNRSKRT